MEQQTFDAMLAYIKLLHLLRDNVLMRNMVALFLTNIC